MKNVIISVAGGVASVEQVPSGVRVHIVDFDNASDNDGKPTVDTSESMSNAKNWGNEMFEALDGIIE